MSQAQYIDVNGYYIRFDPTKNYEKLLAREGKRIQSAETNDMQEGFLYKLKGLGDALFKDGDIISGAQISVNAQNGELFAEGGVLYLAGGMRIVPEATFQVPLVGQISVGVYLTEKVISELEDPSLKNPAVGSRGQGEAGAWRLQINIKWGYHGDGTEGDFFPVHNVDDGIVRPKETPPTLDSFNLAIARYDRDSTGGGTYVSYGLNVRVAEDTGADAQTYTVAEGRCRVNGHGIDFLTSRRLAYPAKPDLRFVDTEIITADGSATQRINVAHPPIHAIQTLRVVLEKVVSVVHGNYVGASDALPDTSVMTLVEIKQGETIFEEGTDYEKQGDSVNWAASGNEPAPGSTYQVKYTYLDKSLTPENADYDGFSVSGAVVGSGIMVSYNQALPRIDRLCVSSNGLFTWVKGVANEYSPKKPAVPPTTLALASVYQEWRENSARKVENDGVRVIPFSDMEALTERVDYALAEIARQRLESDVFTREAGARVGIFVDPLMDDTMRDQGLTQTAAVVDGVLTLPINGKIYGPSQDIASPTSRAFTPKVIIEQPFKTGSMKVNPYMAFEPLPAPVKLTPSVDRWTEVQTSWTSAVTRVFGSGNASNSSSSTQVVSSTTSEVAFLRAIDVKFDITGFGNGEILQDIIFDGVAVEPKEGTLTANAEGELSGTFTVPANIPTGAKTVDFLGGVGGSRGSAVFVGEGTLVAQTLRTVTTVQRWNSDPLAQTFTLDKDTQIAGIDLWFTAKNTEARVQIREVENGVPTKIVLAEKRLLAAEIVVSGGGYTRVLFDAPVSLSAGSEYAFVVLCDDADTSLSIAELGKFDVLKQQWVASQPYQVGVLLSSANASTWTAHQSADLTFRLLEAVYNSGATELALGTVEVDEAATDLVLMATSETPSAAALVEYELGLPSGEVFVVAENQPIRLGQKTLGTVSVKAKLLGNESFSPVLWPGSQLLAGQVQESADYFTRSITASGAIKATLVFDAFIPSGASVTPQIKIDSNSWEDMTLSQTVPQGDGIVEYSYSMTLDGNADLAKVKFTLTGALSARPYVQNIRFMCVK